MHDAVFLLDDHYQIAGSNSVARSWYGYKKEEFLRLNLRDLRAPQERDKITEQMQQVMNENGVMWETIHSRKDGTTFFVEVCCTPILVDNKKHFYHVVRDISERKQEEFALQNSEQRYRKIVELLPDAIYIHKDSKIVFINQAGLKMFGATSKEQLLGKSIWMLYTPDRHEIVQEHNKLLLEKNQPSVPLIEHTMIRLDGKIINVEATACLLEIGGEKNSYVILHDITERKKAKILLEVQCAISKQLLEIINIDEAMNSIINTLCSRLNFEVGKIWTLDEVEKTLRYGDQKIALDYGLAGRVFNTSETSWFDDISIVFIDEEIKANNYKLAIAVPIINDKQVIGVMEFMSSKSQTRDEHLLQVLDGIANQIGSFLNRKVYEKELAYVLQHDSVTGMANRFLFEETLDLEIKLAKNKNKRFAVLFLDINSFSAINEALGHLAGDQLLMLVGKRLSNLLTESDNIARFGADQFAIIFSDLQSSDEINKLVVDVNNAMSQPFIINGQNLNVTISIGVSVYPDDSEDVDSLMKNANIALNRAKESGRGSFKFSTSDMTTKAKKRISIENDLHSALSKNEFLLYYQPIIENPSMIIRGMESLLRWKQHGMIISPYDFIGVAERTHLIIPIGEWIINTACLQCKAWQQIVDEPVFVSVNISPIQFRHSSIIDTLANAMRTSKLDPDCLKVEVTETAVMDDVQNSIKILSKIKDMGIKICIDDFGTGYSSLSYLRNLPIDYIKIDQSFVREVGTNANDAAIVKTIINLADNLGYNVIAEGVETEEQLDFLTKLGCSEIQGYYFSRPISSEDALEFLRQKKL